MKTDYRPWKNYQQGQRVLDYQIKNTEDSITGDRERFAHAKTLQKTHPARLDDSHYEKAIAVDKSHLRLLKARKEANERTEFAEHKTMIEKDHFMSKHGSPKDKRLARSYIKTRKYIEEHDPDGILIRSRG